MRDGAVPQTRTSSGRVPDAFDPAPSRTPVGDTEARMGIVPLEELHAERDTLIEQVKHYRARFGSGGTYTDLRKIELAKVSELIRSAHLGRKMTSAEVEEMAHRHPSYMTWVVDRTVERADWIVLENRIKSIDERIFRDQAVARFLAQEAGFQR